MDASTPRGRVWVRADLWLIATLLACAGAFLALVFVGRSLTFWYDEWYFIRVPGLGTPQDWFTPHNEHWSTLPFLLYRATFLIVGLHSYVPYLAELFVIHLIAVAGVAALVRRDHGPAAAFVAILPLLLLGSGWVNLLWAFQTGFVGSTAAGIWALYALDSPGRRGTVAGAVLLIVSLMCSGIGLFWLTAAGVELVLDGARRRRLSAVVVATLTYVVWHVLYGAGAVSEMDGPSFTLRVLVDVPAFVARGVATAAGSFSGFGRPVGLVVFAGLCVVATVGIVRRTVPPRAFAALVAIVVMYALIGLVRVRFGSDYAVQPRYVYIAAFLLVLALSSILRWVRDEGRFSPGVQAALVGLVAISVVTGLVALRDGKHHAEANAESTRAFVGAAVTNEGAAWVDPMSHWSSMPLPGEVPDLVRRYGDPRTDTVFPWLVGHPPSRSVDAGFVMLMGRNFRAQAGSPPASPAPVRISAATGADIGADNGCLEAVASGAGGSVTVSVPGGGAATLTATSTGETSARIGRNGSASDKTRIPVPLTTGGTTAILVPDTGDGPWQVKVDLPADPVRLCIAPAGN